MLRRRHRQHRQQERCATNCAKLCSSPFSRCSVRMLDYGRQCSQRVIL